MNDVVVVGGGMIGAALALALGRSGFEVALADAGQPDLPADDAPMGLRVSTLTPASSNLLGRLGIWEELAARRTQVFDCMRVWEDDPELELRFAAADAGMPWLGHVVENARVQGLLWHALATCEGVELYPGVQVEDAGIDERGGRVSLDSGERLRGRLLVAADGARSCLRDRFDIEVESWAYGQRGVVAVVDLEAGHDNTAWQRFLPGGPLAFLPLATGQCSIVWSRSEADAEASLEESDEAFSVALTDASQGRFGQVQVAGPRAAFPLVRQRAVDYVRPGLALVGDAAHVIHPLAGQGANLGLLDAASLVQVLEQARERGQPLSDHGVLRRYERWRRTDNELVAEAMSVIQAFFAMDAGPFPAVRRLGTGLLNRSRLARARLIEHASGFGGQVPELVRRQI